MAWRDQSLKQYNLILPFAVALQFKTFGADRKVYKLRDGVPEEHIAFEVRDFAQRITVDHGGTNNKIVIKKS